MTVTQNLRIAVLAAFALAVGTFLFSWMLSPTCPQGWSSSAHALEWANKMQLPNPVADCGKYEHYCSHPICNISWDAKEGRNVRTFECDPHNCIER